MLKPKPLIVLIPFISLLIHYSIILTSPLLLSFFYQKFNHLINFPIPFLIHHIPFKTNITPSFPPTSKIKSTHHHSPSMIHFNLFVHHVRLPSPPLFLFFYYLSTSQSTSPFLHQLIHHSNHHTLIILNPPVIINPFIYFISIPISLLQPTLSSSLSSSITNSIASSTSHSSTNSYTIQTITFIHFYLLRKANPLIVFHPFIVFYSLFHRVNLPTLPLHLLLSFILSPNQFPMSSTNHIPFKTNHLPFISVFFLI